MSTVVKTKLLTQIHEDEMPAIKVYKGAGKMIPLEEAKVARAFQCPWTGDLFATKPSYTKHLRDLRETRMHRRAKEIKHQKLLSQMWNQPDWQSVIDWIHLHGEVFFDIAAGARGLHSKIDPSIRADFKVTITYLQLTWSNSVSNSMACPVGGVTCRSSHEAKDGRPKGYPGWSGRIGYTLSHTKGFGSGSDCWSGTRIHTGVGGGDPIHQRRLDVKMFAQDWPNLSINQTMAFLADKPLAGSFTYGKSK